MKKYNVGVVGATGLVGREMVRMLEKRNFPVANLRLLASQRSRGKTLKFKGREIVVEELNPSSFKVSSPEEKFSLSGRLHMALFSAGGSISREYAPLAAQEGIFVIDNSSAWRMDPEVPLVVPEINSHTLSKDKKIIANPNCSTIQMVVVLAPLHRKARIKRIVVSTYQAVSGAGQKAVLELEEQVSAIASGKKIKPMVFPHQIAYNCIPQIDVFLENGYTKEEMKMVNETRKIMEDDSITITATCVRVPVFRGHSEAVNIETERKITPQEARQILNKAEGIVVVDDISKLKYPLPTKAADSDETFVGRIREDQSIPNGLNMWIVSDNLLKGAALNAVQIGEELINRKILGS
ncbi:aspartate-semialdehyde dehydrogenase [bacterium]|nr:aspartate-semialdehyde dehydrogenase [bacterium]NIN91671.1 aspartate-semialdehyde dehydrogenase [bacterium]NIO18023.1 aspartate-semialdehyde dehydrogenase [bacterium]NIO72986.1 aspartate-semialdehyde dehydrogenase [bacterium]